MINKAQDKSPERISRKTFVKYAYNSMTLKQMPDDIFLDYITFASKQMDVDNLEELRKTLNARKIIKDDASKTPRDYIKLYLTLMVSVLITGFLVFIIVCIVYGLWFMKSDKVKSNIGFSLLMMACGSALIFFTFLALYNLVVLQYKKIMLLL
jgi:hypothetical protein